jgi:NAD(P)H-flavin reductase
MCIIAISAVFRNKSPILWTLFRLSHYIYVVALFFAVCHYPKLAYGLAGPVLVYLIEAVINHIYNPAPEQTDITLAACEDSKCTLLRVHSTHTAGSSDYTYYYLQIPQISRAWHPFFISLPLSWDPSDPHIEFLIKNTDFVYGEFWSQAKGNVPKAGQRNSHAESRSVEGSGSWTSKLYHLALNKTPIESIRFQGPFGQPHLRMTSASNSLFICGGVGIAPVLSCLYTFATGMDEISGNIDRQGSVSMVWVISDASLLNLYGSHLARVRCHLAYLAPKTIVNFSIYITNSTAVAHCCSKKNVGGGHKKNRRKASDLEEPLGSDDPPPQERSEIVVSLPPEFQQELLIHIGSRPHWMEALKPVHAIIGAQMKRAALEADERDGSSSSSRSKKKKAEGSNEADPLGFELEDKGEAEALELCHLLTPNDMRKGVMSLKDCSVYMCGPDGLAEESQAALETLEKAGGEAGPQYLFYQEPFAH